ncbi:MAG: PTS sugar transporter subunit IIA [Calditrichia bacterium]
MQTPLLEMLTPAHINASLTSIDKESVIRELLALVTTNHQITQPDKLLEAIFQREHIMSTGVGNGVAIPHCKSPFSPEFSVTMGIHRNGVDFDAVDNEPVNIIFLVTGPENDPTGHIRLLSRISRIMSREDARQHLIEQKDSESIFRFLQVEERRIFEAKK